MQCGIFSGITTIFKAARRIESEENHDDDTDEEHSKQLNEQTVQAFQNTDSSDNTISSLSNPHSFDGSKGLESVKHVLTVQKQNVASNKFCTGT